MLQKAGDGRGNHALAKSAALIVAKEIDLVATSGPISDCPSSDDTR